MALKTREEDIIDNILIKSRNLHELETKVDQIIDDELGIRIFNCFIPSFNCLISPLSLNNVDGRAGGG